MAHSLDDLVQQMRIHHIRAVVISASNPLTGFICLSIYTISSPTSGRRP